MNFLETNNEDSIPINDNAVDDLQFCVDCVPVKDEDIPPVERVVIPADVADFNEEDDMIYIIGTREGKVTQIRGLERMLNLKSLILRSCLISNMTGIEHLIMLQKLELYDNQIEEISCISNMKNLLILDLSFNSIRELPALAQYVPLLEELYVAQNKLRGIEGLEGLSNLKVLDLGANRIRIIEGLQTNTSLKSLWLGKNKIETICGLETLTQLEQLDIQNNRLTAIGDGLGNLINLRELYLACNKIVDLNGFPHFPYINVIDLSTNGVESVEGIEKNDSLEEFWLSSSALSTYAAITPLTKLPKLTCLYLEHSPVAKDFEYRKTVTRLIPSLQQLDATEVNRTVG